MTGSSRLFTGIIAWIPLAVVFSVALGSTYVGLQQVYRQGANDPQIQMAEDIAERIRLGADPRSIIPAEKVDIAKSLAPYVYIFDAGLNILGTSAELQALQVLPPRGSLESALEHGQNRVTWEPSAGQRQALVVIRGEGVRSDIIAVGRSLRETEAREADLLVLFFVAWTVGLSLSLGAVILKYHLQP